MKPQTNIYRVIVLIVILSLLVAVVPAFAATSQQAPSNQKISLTPIYKSNIAFDVSPALRDVPTEASRLSLAPQSADAEPLEIRPDRGLVAVDQGYSGDGALNGSAAPAALSSVSVQDFTLDANFEGLSNQD